jgi:hypothetical protein
MPSAALTDALIAKLQADVDLQALLPDGVWFKVAPQGSTRFVRVSLIAGIDVPVFRGRGYEDALYRVEAVVLSSSGGDALAGAARIDELLDHQTLAIVGYGLMVLRRTAPVQDTEVDEIDAAIRWDTGGGDYQLMAAPAAA